MAVPVDRDRAHRSVLHLRVEPALRQQFVELAAALAGHEPIILDLLQAGLARQAIGTIIRKEDVRSALHQGAGKADRRPSGPHTGDCTGPPVGAIHDRGIQLDQSFGVEGAAPAGVEAGVVFQHANGSFDRVDRASAFAQD